MKKDWGRALSWPTLPSPLVEKFPLLPAVALETVGMNVCSERGGNPCDGGIIIGWLRVERVGFSIVRSTIPPIVPWLPTELGRTGKRRFALHYIHGYTQHCFPQAWNIGDNYHIHIPFVRLNAISELTPQVMASVAGLRPYLCGTYMCTLSPVTIDIHLGMRTGMV